MEPKHVTESGIIIHPDYEPDDVDPRIGRPGSPPFTRGIHENMYRGKVWTMRQYAGFGDPASTNERFRALMAAGQRGLSVAFDLPTQLGYDSDDPIARPEVGRVGVAVDTLADFEALFDGIELDAATPSFTINAPAVVIAAMYVAMARGRGLDLARLRATYQNDILKEYLSRGTYIFPPAASMRLTTDLIEYCAKEAPSIYPISISGAHTRDAGANGVEAMAIMLAAGFAYLQGAIDRGLNPVRVASRFSFLFNTRQDPLVEAAQLRAARRMWATILQERWGITDPGALKFRFYAGTSNQMFTRREPLNNVVRATLGTLGMVLGGAQAIHVLSYDEAFDIPSPESARIALRTQQILAYETHLTSTVDPLAGSYYVEAMTDAIEEQAREFIDTLDEKGGVAAAVESGWLQSRVSQGAYDFELAIANGDQPQVGVNVFEDPAVKAEEQFADERQLHQVDPAVVERRVDALERHRADRDSDDVAAALADVRRAASSDENVVWPIEQAVTHGATLGECVGVLRETFGEFHEGGRI